MPFNGHVGYSINTPKKQEHYHNLLKVHMDIVKGILQRNGHWAQPTYLLLDLNAGPGVYHGLGQSISGSPLIACAIAHALDLPMHAIFCERGEEELASLRQELIQFGLSRHPSAPDHYHNTRTLNVTLCPGDYRVTATRLLDVLVRQQRTKQYGLIYSDENGSFPPFDLLAAYARELHYMDIVIYVAASPIKWQRISRVHALTERLDEMLHRIDKKYWLVRKPSGPHQFSFLIGTNWDAFPTFHKQDFARWDTPAGNRIVRELSFSTKERQAHDQGNLFPEEENNGNLDSA
jgi:hypothetical protein